MYLIKRDFETTVLSRLPPTALSRLFDTRGRDWYDCTDCYVSFLEHAQRWVKFVIFVCNTLFIAVQRNMDEVLLSGPNENAGCDG